MIDPEHNWINFKFQMGLLNVELYNNLGLSCFYAQQYDMTLACMERALEMANEETLGKVSLLKTKKDDNSTCQKCLSSQP